MRDSALQHYLSRTVMLGLKVLVLLAFLQFVLLSAGRVKGQSMDPTFNDGDRLLIFRLGYFFHPPHRFDTVQLIDPEEPDKLIVKRIIGLPGETISFHDQTISIQHTDGSIEQLQEPYLPSGMVTHPTANQPSSILIPANYYYVLGDNRGVSKDSRVFGAVHRRLINGRAFML
jgi:signal peptidase I